MTSLLPDLGSFDIRQLLQTAFVLAASTILLLSSLPSLRARFVTYGSRATSIAADHSGGDGPKKALQDSRPQPGWLHLSLDLVTDLQVPHAWFLHFYVVSVACSLFWGIHIVLKSSFLMTICEKAGAGGTLSINQIALMWSMMAVQGVRRLAESIMSGKSSTSKMWFVHWVLGIAFYLAVNVAVWVEGAESLQHSPSPWRDITIEAPSIRTMLGLPLFILASGIQNDCHAYLASLPKYTLPDHPIFHTMVCPHYTAECLIYFSLAVMGAPQGAWINRTVFSALLFVASNLAVTASATKHWYMQKFGREKVETRWRMIPFVF